MEPAWARRVLEDAKLEPPRLQDRFLGGAKWLCVLAGSPSYTEDSVSFRIDRLENLVLGRLEHDYVYYCRASSWLMPIPPTWLDCIMNDGPRFEHRKSPRHSQVWNTIEFLESCYETSYSDSTIHEFRNWYQGYGECGPRGNAQPFFHQRKFSGFRMIHKPVRYRAEQEVKVGPPNAPCTGTMCK